MKLIGYFETISEGNNPGSPNCFLFPLPNGAWKVYRFSQGINEASTWSQDGNGWTTCYFNRTPDLSVAAKAHGGIEDPDKTGEFVFDGAKEALEAASVLGEKINLMDDMMEREVRLKTAKDGRLAVEIAKEERRRQENDWVARQEGQVGPQFSTPRPRATRTTNLAFLRTRQSRPRVDGLFKRVLGLGALQRQRVVPRTSQQRQDASSKFRNGKTGGRKHYG